MELLPLLRPYVNTCVVHKGMPYTVLRQPRLLGLSAALTIMMIDLDLLANVGGTVSCLFLVGVCKAFYQFRLGAHNLPVVAGRFSGTDMLQGLTGYAHTVVALLLPMNCT